MLRKPANPSPGTARRLIPRFAAVLSALLATLFFVGQAAAATPIVAAAGSLTTLAGRTAGSAPQASASPVTALAQAAAPVTSVVQRVSAQATNTLADATPASLATHAEGAVGSVLSTTSGAAEAAVTGVLDRVIASGAPTITSEGPRVATVLRAAQDPAQPVPVPATGTVGRPRPSTAQPKAVAPSAASSAPTAGASPVAPAVAPATSAATDRASRLPARAPSCGRGGSCAGAQATTATIAGRPQLALSSPVIGSALSRRATATALSGQAHGSRTAPARPRPEPVPSPGGASPVAGVGSGFSPPLLLALASLLLLCSPGVMRRLARASERWRPAPLALISARPG
jgi:hypothetical protein